MQGRPSSPIRWPRQSSKAAYEQRSLPTLRDRADFPSCGVVLGAPAPRPVGPPRSRRSSRLPADLVASLLGHYPTASAPPCLRGNLPRSQPRRILRQAPKEMAPPVDAVLDRCSRPEQQVGLTAALKAFRSRRTCTMFPTSNAPWGLQIRVRRKPTPDPTPPAPPTSTSSQHQAPTQPTHPH